MSEFNPFTQRVVLELPGMGDVHVRSDIAYKAQATGDDLQLDLYSPPGPDTAARPAVVFVVGWPDAVPASPGKFKDTAVYASWAELVACSGCAAVLYEAADPAADARAVLAYLRDNAVRPVAERDWGYPIAYRTRGPRRNAGAECLPGPLRQCRPAREPRPHARQSCQRPACLRRRRRQRRVAPHRARYPRLPPIDAAAGARVTDRIVQSMQRPGPHGP